MSKVHLQRREFQCQGSALCNEPADWSLFEGQVLLGFYCAAHGRRKVAEAEERGQDKVRYAQEVENDHE